MGWFDEQIEQRKKHDDAIFSDSFIEIADAILGERMSAALSEEGAVSKGAIEDVLKYYHIKPQELPSSVKNADEQMEYMMRPHGIMRRRVLLKKGWYRDAFGALMATRKDNGHIVALIPGKAGGYTFFDESDGSRKKVNRSNEGLFDEEAISFYLPFPLKKMGMKELLSYIIHTLDMQDVVRLAAATLAVTLVGMLLPKINKMLFSDVLMSGSFKVLAAAGIYLVCVIFSSTFLGAVKTLASGAINTKLDVSVEAATMMRILSLPADFFKAYSPGELASRTGYIKSLCSTITNSVLSVGLSSIFSLIYIGQIFAYAPALVAPAMIIIVVTVLISVITTLWQMQLSRRRMEAAALEIGMNLALISGVQKLRLAGAEKRAFAKWGKLYAREARLTYDIPTFLKVSGVISSAIGMFGQLFLYYGAVASGVSVADYYAFNTSYGMVQGAFLSLSGIALIVAEIQPVLKMMEPIMQAEPEVAEGKLVLERLSGGVEMSHVSFKYKEGMPNILDDLSLKIRPGQYVAIVGKTGCGKSTLMRILLGFEKPQKGAVYYDGRDLNQIDLKSLRRKIGTVMQTGGLFQGSLFSNITISAPQLTQEDAWEAAEMAGIADDIRRMPMGMHTFVSEGGGGISGGQRQRLMIARAIAPKPKILMFDEATSALDNLTQKKVSESLDGLKCTRIVIAHRLSTIRQCDRIIVLDGGHIVEDGTYDELIDKGGFFADLVERQRVDVAAAG